MEKKERRGHKKDTYNSMLYFQNLLKRYPRVSILEALDITPASLWRYCNGRVFPGKKIMSKLAQFEGKTDDQVLSEIYPQKDKKVPPIEFKEIRQCILKYCFYHHQANDVLFSEEITFTERKLITYLYLIKKGIKALYNQRPCEIIDQGREREALEFYENSSDLQADFSEYFGHWMLINHHYFFSRCSNNVLGVKFVDNDQEFHEYERRLDDSKNEMRGHMKKFVFYYRSIYWNRVDDDGIIDEMMELLEKDRGLKFNQE